MEVHEAGAIEQDRNGENLAEIWEGMVEWSDAEKVALVGAGFIKQWVRDKLVAHLKH